MTDRGIPIVDGAPACPFVAFEDDRDSRALAPDHRHRCFADPRPAPRALAHQEAYCLSSAFPVCPTFQDWARREAAAARPAPPEGRAERDEPPVSTPLPPRDREPRHALGTDTPPPVPPRRHQPRDWAAPPPWSGDEADAGPGRAGTADAQPPGFLADRPAPRDDDWGAASRGLAGSAADRLAGPGAGGATPLPRASRPMAPEQVDRYGEDDGEEEDAWAPPPSRAAAPPPGRRPVRRGAEHAPAGSGRRDQVRPRGDEDASQMFGPAWEQPRRFEAYPTLRPRVGLPGLPSFSGLGIAVAALALAAVVLFFVGPMLLGLGGNSPDAGVTPSPTVDAGASASPTLPPEPTPQLYVVAKNDTISKIAKKFGVTIEELLAANPKIKNPDRIAIGDEITIPVPAPANGLDGGDSSTVP